MVSLSLILEGEIGVTNKISKVIYRSTVNQVIIVPKKSSYTYTRPTNFIGHVSFSFPLSSKHDSQFVTQNNFPSDKYRNIMKTFTSCE